MQLGQAIDDFTKGYFATNERSKKTRVAYCCDLSQFRAYAGENLALPRLTEILVEEWAAHLEKEGYSPASRRRKIIVLKVFCSYWVRKGRLKQSPFWRVRLSFGRIQQLPRALTETEMRTLLAQAGQNRLAFEVSGKGPMHKGVQGPHTPSRAYRALRNLALIDLLFATGMRVGEASALDRRDFVVTESVFRVQGKGGRDRLAFVVDEQTVRIQAEHLEARSQIVTESPALFLNASGERLSTQGMANIIAQFRRDAGIERHVTPHMLRHTVATLLLRNGVDIRVVQEFLGHASIATTQRYTHIAKEHLIDVLRKHHPSLGLRGVCRQD